MSYDLKERPPHNLSHIDLVEAWEVRWWCVKFGVTEDQLRKAVDAAGQTPADVERHLKEAARNH